MGFTEGKIVLDSDTGAYDAGQTIKGKLVFTQDKVKTFRGIYVQVKGYANVHWTTSHTRRVNERTETYHINHNAHEEYFRTKQYLVGSASGEHNLQPGHYDFPFQSHIPEHCPSSFEGSHGKIRYEIKIVVDRSFKLDQELKTTFQVVAPLDLNKLPELREPLEIEMVESYCCFCVSSGSSNTQVKLPGRGFVPGEVVPLEVSCRNTSSLTINKIKFKITKTTTYHAHENPATKSEEDTVVEVRKGPVLPGSAKNWTVPLEVPIMDVNHLAACQIINVHYNFEVKVSPSGCHEDSEESTEITIGTIPFRPLDETSPPSDQPQAVYPPVNSPYPPTINVQQCPPVISPYPASNTPYPAGNSSYPPGNSPHTPSNLPYPGGNPPAGSPYPHSVGSVPYPTGSSVNPVSPPYPGVTPPYVAGTSPFPSAGAVPMPLPAPPASPGFRVAPDNPEAVPLLPYNNGAPPVSMYTSPSAPMIPADDKQDNKQSPSDPPTNQYAYNPYYVSPDNN